VFNTIVDQQIDRFNEYLDSISPDELQKRSEEWQRKCDEDFAALKTALSHDSCYYCGHSLTHFSRKSPCFHWLLWKAKGLRKKYFPLLFATTSYHQVETYLRWVANSEAPIQNINDLVEEKSSTKFIETTIRYKNLEWSFSCSHGDRLGHKDKTMGRDPHYHFQMKIDSKVVINYNGLHIPFTEYDEFCFAVERGAFNRLKAAHTYGAGMQALFDNYSGEELVSLMRKATDEETATYNVSTILTADPWTTISGEQIAELAERRNRTGESFAKLARDIPNASVQAIISPGPGVPEIASRKKNRS
jgi:hypothetical protein